MSKNLFDDIFIARGLKGPKLWPDSMDEENEDIVKPGGILGGFNINNPYANTTPPPTFGGFGAMTMDYRPERDGHFPPMPLSADPMAPPTEPGIANAVPANEPPSIPSPSPWQTINKDKLTGILYNEMSSFRGDPQKLEQAMWATAGVIKNRQAAGIAEKPGSLASPVIADKEWQAINNENYPDNPARKAYNMASGVAGLITSAPDAFPSPWPYTQYNHRGTDSKADHEIWRTPVMEQFGPFQTYAGNKWLNIFGPKKSP